MGTLSSSKLILMIYYASPRVAWLTISVNWKGLHQVARCMTKRQCMQIIVLWHGNRIPRICIIPRWYQTAEKEVTSDSCINATKKCQRVA
jgi:hypothetical protein